MIKLLSSRGGRAFLILLGGIIAGLGFTIVMDYISNRAENAKRALEAQETPQYEHAEALDKLREHFALQYDEFAIIIRVSEQMLYLVKDGATVVSYPISASAYGIGSRAGSNKTPLGTHRIAETYGDGAPLGAVFRSRVNTGQVAKIYTDDTDVEDDLVTTRIMWLDGQEAGANKGAGVDSHSRYIYIHGTQEEGLIGGPASHGCIRMKNQDVVHLFDQVKVGTLVEIVE